MLFRPKLGNGEHAPLTWPIAAFRRINNICWPLEDHASIFIKIFDVICLLLFLGSYVQQQDATIRYLITNYRTMDDILDGFIDYLVHLDMSLRALNMCANRQNCKRFLKKYYGEVYIEESTHPEMFRSIKRKLLPTYVYSVAYIISTIMYLLTPVIVKSEQERRDLSFPMIYPFDITPRYIFWPICLYNSWNNVVIVSLMVGDANLMSEALMHLHGRYLMLEEDLQRFSKELLKNANSEEISRKFSTKIKEILQRNVELNKFAAEMRVFYTYRIFIMLAFSAVMLCVLAFTFYTKFIMYNIFFMSSKIGEMIAIGEIGSTITVTTDAVSSMYFNCNWELIISKSSNTRENIKLIKLLVTAIETNQKSFALTGLNFFSLSVSTVTRILQAAGSYFTWLLSIHEG